MGLLADLSLPLGASEFTNDYVIPKVLFLATNSLTERLGLTYNIGPSLITADEEGKKRTDWDLNYAVALSGGVSPSVSLFGEFYGALASGSGRSDRHSFQAGATVLLKPTLQFDLRAGFGFVDDVPDWLVGLGLAFRLPH